VVFGDEVALLPKHGREGEAFFATSFICSNTSGETMVEEAADPGGQPCQQQGSDLETCSLGAT
ncbi:MAG: hypothetical protein R3330_18300, partial [Saprospiraceae bacterium]|nr:hypothetical protein [Saprospiraceae bacterium]